CNPLPLPARKRALSCENTLISRRSQDVGVAAAGNAIYRGFGGLPPDRPIHWSHVKSCGSQNESQMTPLADAAADGAAPGVGGHGDSLLPLAFGPTPGRNLPKLVSGGFVPRSSGPKRLDGARRLDVPESSAVRGSLGDGIVPLAFGPTPGRN